MLPILLVALRGPAELHRSPGGVFMVVEGLSLRDLVQKRDGNPEEPALSK